MVSVILEVILGFYSDLSLQQILLVHFITGATYSSEIAYLFVINNTIAAVADAECAG